MTYRITGICNSPADLSKLNLTNSQSVRDDSSVSDGEASTHFAGFVVTKFQMTSKNQTRELELQYYFDTGPMVEAYNDAFSRNYDEQYYVQGHDKIVRIFSSKVVVDNVNKYCFSFIGKVLNQTLSRRNMNKDCALIYAENRSTLCWVRCGLPSSLASPCRFRGRGGAC